MVVRHLRKISTVVALVVICAGFTAGAADLPGINFSNGYLTGKVRGGKAPAGAIVFAFSDLSGPPPSTELYWRAPDFVGELEGSGSFRLEVPAGWYYVVVMSRQQGQDIGPPQPGDIFYYLPDAAGNPVRYEVVPLKTTDLGVLDREFPFKKENVRYDKGVTAIQGKITGADGKAVVGALVFAYRNPSMFGRPLFVSERSGADGRYILRLSEGGTYYLKVRSVYGGGRPAVGEAMGDFRNRNPDAVVIKTGQKVPGVDFTVVPFAGKPDQSLK